MLFVITLLFIGTFPSVARAADFDHAHAAFTKVLQRFLKDTLVDYTKLKRDPKDLNAYLDRLAAVKETEFKRWTKPQQVAYLLNLYNAQTLRLIIDHYPKIKSIRDIGNYFKGPWDQPVVPLFGKMTTLDKLEKQVLLKKYPEPRAHFALVCAALGCPPLRHEAYSAVPMKKGKGTVLDAQLHDQGRRFLATTRKNRVDAASKIVYLSPIFKWFKGDFVAESGSVLAFVTPYFSNEAQRALLKGGFKIRYTKYDWTLNDRKPRAVSGSN